MRHRLSVTVIVALFMIGTATAQDWAKARIDNSPRHLEWITVRHGNREVKWCFIGYPEVKNKATAVVMIHEIFGHTDWVRSVVDQLAEAGYIAIAPDLLSGMAPGGGGSAELGGDVRRVIGSLPPDQITADLNATADYVAGLPACNGRVAVGGFCWGGRETFRFACNNGGIKAAFVFYGDAPSAEEMKRIKCPVYGFYGGNDARITAAVPETTEMMKRAGTVYDPVVYEGAGHGFMRSGEDPAGSPANKKARVEAWARWLELLKNI